MYTIIKLLFKGDFIWFLRNSQSVCAICAQLTSIAQSLWFLSDYIKSVSSLARLFIIIIVKYLCRNDRYAFYLFLINAKVSDHKSVLEWFVVIDIELAYKHIRIIIYYVLFAEALHFSVSLLCDKFSNSPDLDFVWNFCNLAERQLFPITPLCKRIL